MPQVNADTIGRELGNEGSQRFWLPLLQHLGINPASYGERAFYDPSGEGGPTYGVGFDDATTARLNGLTYNTTELPALDGRAQRRYDIFDASGNPLTSYQVGGDSQGYTDTMIGLIGAATLAAAGSAAYGAYAGGGSAAGADASYLAAADAAGGMVPQYGTTAAYNAGIGLGEAGAAGSGSYNLFDASNVESMYNIPQSGSTSSMNASGGYNLIDGTGNMNALYSTPSQGQFAGMNLSQLDAARAGLGAASAASSGGRSQPGGQGGLLGNLGQYGQYGRLIAGLLGGAAGGLGGGSDAPQTITYGDPVQWNSELQRGLLTTPKRVSSGLLGSN